MAENILKINNDYFDISKILNLDDYNIMLFKNFDYRPNMSLDLTNIKYFKFESNIYRINHEDIIDFIRTTPLQINYNTSADGCIRQIFPNIAIKIPNIFRLEYNTIDRYHILNSINLKEIYDHIFELSEFDKDKYIFVYTKNYYVSKKNTSIKTFDKDTAYFYNYYYIIPHINVFFNYEKVDNKYLCELSGTIIN
jgi:hypothetical protein